MDCRFTTFLQKGNRSILAYKSWALYVADCSSTVGACDITCHDSTWGCGWGAWEGERCLETQITPDLKWMDVDKSYIVLQEWRNFIFLFWWSFSYFSMWWQIVELVCVGRRAWALDAWSIMFCFDILSYIYMHAYPCHLQDQLLAVHVKMSNLVFIDQSYHHFHDFQSWNSINCDSDGLSRHTASSN